MSMSSVHEISQARILEFVAIKIIRFSNSMEMKCEERYNQLMNPMVLDWKMSVIFLLKFGEAYENRISEEAQNQTMENHSQCSF